MRCPSRARSWRPGRSAPGRSRSGCGTALGLGPADWLRQRFGSPATEPRGVVATAVAALAFIAFSAWWLSYDHRIPGGGDASRQLYRARRRRDVGRGEDRRPVRDQGPDDLIASGPTGLLLSPAGAHDRRRHRRRSACRLRTGGRSRSTCLRPMLAAGCYGVGRLVFGPSRACSRRVRPRPRRWSSACSTSSSSTLRLRRRRARGLGAARIGVLQSPSRVVVAGALVGVALLVKSLAVVFFAGPVRGDDARGRLATMAKRRLLALAALVVAGPYYAVHLTEVVSLSGQTTSAASSRGGAGLRPLGRVLAVLARQLPLLRLGGGQHPVLRAAAAAFAAGLVARGARAAHAPSAARAAGRPRRQLPRPHLRALDPRPALHAADVVYVAVLATGWIPGFAGSPSRRPRWRS